MMRNRSWIIVSKTYGTDFSGDFRARSRREGRELLNEWEEEIAEEAEARAAEED